MSFAAIQIDSVHTTISTCPNNGSITIFASTDKPQLFYSIIDGPVTDSVQTNNTFSSLPPGKYTIKVIDAFSETATKQDVIIIGNYTPINFNLFSISPYCGGGNDGAILGDITSGTGCAPYSWQLIAPSTVTSVPQSSDTFNNLPEGNYTIRVTDFCGIYSTTSIKVNKSTSASRFNISSIYKVGCDTLSLTFTVRLPTDTSNFQDVISFKTRSGTINPAIGSPNTIIDSSKSSSHTFFVKQLFPSLTYGDTINIAMKNTSCDNFTPYSVQYDPFKFTPVFKKTFDKCTRKTTLIGYSFGNGGVGLMGSSVHYTVTDLIANKVITDSTLNSNVKFGTMNYLPVYGVNPLDLIYKLTVTDGCGLVFTSIDTVPSIVLSKSTIKEKLVYPSSCLDSVAAATIATSGLSNSAKLTLLSGPTSFGSTKRGYAYTNTISYPIVILTTDGSFYLKSLPAGKYVFKIEDSCGSLTDSFNVKTSDLGSLNFGNVKSERSCSSNNITYFNFSGEGTIGFKNLETDSFVSMGSFNATKPAIDTISPNLPSGKYAISYFFGSNSVGTPIANNNACSTSTDTVTIINYQTPSIRSSNSIICKDNIEVVIIPDSSRGKPPFLYEVIKGPQMFPVQSSNVFEVSAAGIYTARILDKCGNVSVTNITVDTLSFLPIKTIASVCTNSVKLFYGSSVYYTFNWSKGKSFNYTGDTLNIPFIAAADTGIYTVKEMVNINGCRDTLYSSYHLYGGHYFVRDYSICKGSSVTIGSNNYNTPGSRFDTLINLSGCDSIVKSNISFITPKTKSILLEGCDSVLLDGKNYTSSTIVHDTLSGVGGCDSIYRTVNIKIVPRSLPAITLKGNDTLCQGIAATYVAISTNAGNKPSFKWEVNGINLPSKDSIFTSKVLKNNDSIRCTVTSNALCQTVNSAQSNVIKAVVLPILTPEVSITPSDYDVCVNYPVLFTASSVNGGSNPQYQWQINNRNTGTNVDTFESSSLQNGDNVNCVLASSVLCANSKTTNSNTIVMSVSPGNCDTMFVPSAFNPFSTVNAYNKFLRPFSNGKTIKKLTFRVYNRFGKQVFESHDLNNAWDGRIDGIMQDVGTYVWTLAYTKSSGKETTTNGTAVLIY